MMRRIYPLLLLLTLAAGPVADARAASKAATAAGAAPAIPSAEAMVHYGRARVLEENGDDAGALAEFLRVLALDPHAGSAARRASEVAARMGETSRSLELAERALAIDSSDARARWLKGTAEFNLGRTREALASLEAADAAD